MSALMQWAYYDSTWYVYEREGNNILASQMHMKTTAAARNGTNGRALRPTAIRDIGVWYSSIGVAPPNGARGVAHVYASPSAGIFVSMAVAGIRRGFCGVTRGLFKAMGSAEGCDFES